MKITLTFLLLFICTNFAINAQERGDYVYYNLYKTGKASLSDTSNNSSIEEDYNFGNFTYDIGVTLDNYYFRLDISSIVGTFLDAVFTDDEATKRYIQSTNFSIGVIAYNMPITISSNSDLALGLAGFIDSVAYDTVSGFGTYGVTLIADYQLSDYLNVFTEVSRGRRKDGTEKNKKFEIRTKVGYNIHNGIYTTLGLGLENYATETDESLKELSVRSVSFGLLFSY